MKHEISQEILEKVTKSKLLTTQEIMFQDEQEIFGDNKKHKLNFDLYDGFGYCQDYKGNSYFITYPRLDFVNNCKGIASSIREFMGMKEDDEITVTDIVQSYCDLHKM